MHSSLDKLLSYIISKTSKTLITCQKTKRYPLKKRHFVKYTIFSHRKDSIPFFKT